MTLPLDVTIEYVDARNAATRRDIRIEAVERRGGRTYLSAYCYGRQALRTFRLDRVRYFIDEHGECHSPEQVLGPLARPPRHITVFGVLVALALAAALAATLATGSLGAGLTVAALLVGPLALARGLWRLLFRRDG